jgi:oligopeptide/dipeptide ABC transporter ATP-binding protein
VVYAGQVRELGSAEDVLGAPADPYTQRLLASIPSLHDPAPPEFLPGAPPDLRDDIEGCRFRTRCPLAYEPCAEEPPYVDVGHGHHARCWRHDRRRRPDAGGRA